MRASEWRSALAGLCLFILIPVGAQAQGLDDGGLTFLPHESTYATQVMEQDSPTGGEGAHDAEETEQAVGPAISVVGTPEFVEATMEQFDLLRATSVGRGIIKNIEETGYTVEITETPDDNGYAGAVDGFDLSWRQDDGSPGPGGDAWVKFNPNREGPAATLGHELIHAMHITMGVLEPGRVPDGPNAGSRWPEMQAIGLEKFKDDPLTENRLRDELNALEGDLEQDMVYQQRDTHRGKPPMLDRDEAEEQTQQAEADADLEEAYGGASKRLNDLFGGGK